MTGHLGWRASQVDPVQRDAYLRRLGFLEPPPATVDTLRELHRAHVERAPSRRCSPGSATRCAGT